MSLRSTYPWDGRDQELQAELYHNEPLQRRIQNVEEENLRLKQLLRSHGVPWSSFVCHHPNFSQPVNGHDIARKDMSAMRTPQEPRRTRSSRSISKRTSTHALPHLPLEVLLRILHYALTSPEPIIDPLDRLRPENMTVREKAAGNQVAIGFLAASKACHLEGTRMFWSNNTFTFTNVHSLRNFATHDLGLRSLIRHINLRIIAQYYDDERRKHFIEKDYHNSLKRKHTLRVMLRPKEQTLSRRGFRVYGWAQLVDFLDAMRPPFDAQHDKTRARPRLLPELRSMRIDFVNFLSDFLPFAGPELHNVAAHELGCTLDELAVTGLPSCEAGSKVHYDLRGLLKDDGLNCQSCAAFIQTAKGSLRALDGGKVDPKVVRSWRRVVHDAREARAAHADASDVGSTNHHHHGLSYNIGEEFDPDHAVFHSSQAPNLPAAPEELGHPESVYRKRKTLWKRVPIGRDAVERQWLEFDRASGLPLDIMSGAFGDLLDEDISWCSVCGQAHSTDDDDDDDDDLFG